MSKNLLIAISLVWIAVTGIFYLFTGYYKERRLYAGQPSFMSKQKVTEGGGQQVHVEEKTMLATFMNTMTEKLKELKSRLSDREDFSRYTEKRNEILKLLPNLTAKTYDINFHVLVDKADKPYNQRYKVVVLVSSNVPNFKRRENIRRFWGNYKNWRNNMWRIFFITGGSDSKDVMAKLYDEAVSFKDVIIEDVPESFYHMAEKVMIGLQWAHVNFNYDYLLKCDDDIFVHMDHLTNQLKEYKQRTYFGQAMIGQPVERKGRYALTREEHEKDTFHPYCSGGGFVMSHDTIEKIIPLFNWEHPLKIDDAFFGGLAFKVGSVAKQGVGFYMWNDKCEVYKDMVIVHPVKERACMEKLQNASRTQV